MCVTRLTTHHHLIMLSLLVLFLFVSVSSQQSCNRLLFDASTTISGRDVLCNQDDVPDTCDNSEPHYYCHMIKVDASSYLTLSTSLETLCTDMMPASAELVSARAVSQLTPPGDVTYLEDSTWTDDISSSYHYADLTCQVTDFPSGTTTTDPSSSTEDTTTQDTTTVDTTTDSTTTTSNPNGTITPPGGVPILPGYQIAMEGTFESGNGDDFSSSCQSSYSEEFSDQTFDMIPIINAEIGSSLCTSSVETDEFRAFLTSTSLNFNGAQGSSFASFSLRVREGSLNEVEINACAEEISVFLEDHSNWGRPVVPPISGCPSMDFVPEEFTTQGYEWLCRDNVFSGSTESLLQDLRYSVNLRGDLEADADLTASCTNAYLQELRDSTARMILATNQLMGTDLCQGLTVRIIQGSVTLDSSGATATSFQNFILDAEDTHTFDEVYACAAETSVHLQSHGNWNQPILPPVANCPVLDFIEPNFAEDGQEWTC